MCVSPRKDSDGAPLVCWWSVSRLLFSVASSILLALFLSPLSHAAHLFCSLRFPFGISTLFLLLCGVVIVGQVAAASTVAVRAAADRFPLRRVIAPSDCGCCLSFCLEVVLFRWPSRGLHCSMPRLARDLSSRPMDCC